MPYLIINSWENNPFLKITQASEKLSIVIKSNLLFIIRRRWNESER